MPASLFHTIRYREQALPRHQSCSATTFQGDVSEAPGLMHRMELQRTLAGHGGCVNTVAFNPAGDLLISGSDDQSVMLWDWRTGVRRLRFEPGHTNNIFQARMLPGTADRTLVSCAADGQVRVSYFREGSSRPASKRLHRHQGRAHKLALQHASPYDPSYGSGAGGPPCFYSSGEDGDVCFFDLRVADSDPLGRMAATAGGGSPGSRCGGSDGPRRSRPRQVIDLNAVHVNPARPWQLVVGGADEAVLVYDNRMLTSLTSSYVSSSSPSGARAAAAAAAAAPSAPPPPAPRCQRVHGRVLLELCPGHLRVTDPAAFRRPTHVTCVMFGRNGDVLATYNDDDVYLFRPPGTQGSGGGEGRPGGKGSGPDDSSDDDGDESGKYGSRWPRRGGGGGGFASSSGRGGGGGSVRRSGGGDSGGEDGEEEEEEEDESFLRPSRRRRRHQRDAGGGGGDGGGGGGGVGAGSGRGGGGAGSSGRAASWAGTSLGSGSGGGVGGGGCEDGGDGDGDYVIRRFTGHRNNQTVKGVNFLGSREEWVVSGSDCGHIYIWCRSTGRLHAWLRGDSYVVNCLEPHPHLPLHMATSGIDDDIKLWAPTAGEPHPPGPAAEAAMRDNREARDGARSRAMGGRRVVLSRAALMAWLRDMTRQADIAEGEAGASSGGGGGGGGRGGAAPGRDREDLYNLLLSAVRAGDLDNDEEDDDDGDDNDDDDDDDEEDESDDDEEEEEGEEDEDVEEEEEEDEAGAAEERARRRLRAARAAAAAAAAAAESEEQEEQEEEEEEDSDEGDKEERGAGGAGDGAGGARGRRGGRQRRTL